ncbi:MAG: pyridoxine 5'-phosphate synthase, partial [Verrucomicrobiota bacterium]
ASAVSIPINFEMGNTPEIVDIALAQKPEYVCLVPEIREEITTEGGLDVVGNREALRQTVQSLQKNGTSVSMFIDPEPEQVEASAEIGARMIELHTGAYANATGLEAAEEVRRLAEAARQGHGLGLQINAGHGINQANIKALYQVPHMVELNIGHHLVSRALFVGLQQSIVEMRALMDGYPESF